MPFVQSWVWRMVEPSVQARSGTVVMPGAGAWECAGVVTVTVGVRMGSINTFVSVVGVVMESVGAAIEATGVVVSVFATTFSTARGYPGVYFRLYSDRGTR